MVFHLVASGMWSLWSPAYMSTSTPRLWQQSWQPTLASGESQVRRNLCQLFKLFKPIHRRPYQLFKLIHPHQQARW